MKGERSIEKILRENPEPGFGELTRLTEEGPQIFYPQAAYQPQTTDQKTKEGKDEVTKERKTNRGFLFLVGSIGLAAGLVTGYAAKTYEGKLLERIEGAVRHFASYPPAEKEDNFVLPLVPIERGDQK